MYRVLGSDQKEYGPVGADQIRQWLIDRRLNANSLLQAEGSTEWKPLSFFPEFSATLANVTPVSVPQTQPALQTGSQNPMAVTGLVCGALSIVCCWCSPLFAVLGITFSIIGLSQIKHTPGQRGKELAIAGIVLGSLGLAEFAALMIAGAFAQMFDKIRH